MEVTENIMKIGQVIREYRKKLGMTQEEMADRLGVTTPAVNKWEKDVSKPDIELLAPIARLLKISLDTLLTFREDLTEAEIGDIVQELGDRLDAMPYDRAFAWAQDAINKYPNCNRLIRNIDTVDDFRKSGLYRHLHFEERDAKIYEKLKTALLEGFRNEEPFAFMRGNAEWEAMLAAK